MGCFVGIHYATFGLEDQEGHCVNSNDMLIGLMR